MIAWSSIGRIDIVATAPGKIVVAGGTKVIQPFDTGVIKAIHVRDGQRVKAGDSLIELDPTITDSERAHLQSDLMSARLDVARLNASLGDLNDPLKDFVPPGKGRGLAARDAAQPAAEPGRRAARQAHARSIASWRRKKPSGRRSPPPSRSSRRRSPTSSSGSTSASTWSTRSWAPSSPISRTSSSSPRRSYEAGRAESPTRRRRRRSPRGRAAGADGGRVPAHPFRELDEAERKADGLEQDVIKAEQRSQAPDPDRAGRRRGAAARGAHGGRGGHAGATITGDRAARRRLEIEAMSPTATSASSRRAQEAQIKIDTFNFTRYGLLHGTVLSVSHDAISRQKPVDPTARTACRVRRTPRASRPARSWSIRRASRSTRRR